MTGTERGMASSPSDDSVPVVTAREMARKLATEFEGSLNEKDALDAYLARTLENQHIAIPEVRAEYYHRLGANFVRGLSRPTSLRLMAAPPRSSSAYSAPAGH
jgi:hypothetical protein